MDYDFIETYNVKENCWDIKIVGEVDIFNSNQLKEKMLELIKQNECDLKIDCTNLKYIDSTALGALVAILKRVKTYSGEIYLLNLKSNVKKLFDITNLNKVFIIEGDAND